MEEVKQEIIEQRFDGSPQELYDYIIQFLRFSSQGDFGIEPLEPTFHRYYVEELIEMRRLTPEEQKERKIPDHLESTSYEYNRVGVLEINSVTENPPRSSWFCKPLGADKYLAEGCRKFANTLAEKIEKDGYGPAAIAYDPDDYAEDETDTTERQQSKIIASNPWEQIPDIGDNRTIIELWNEGYLAKEIGRRISRTSKTVHNRLSDLRKIYGEEVVPRRR